jgi:tetratricopeptide (TPR) repeat protein
MQLELRSPFRRICFLVACLFFAGVYLFFVLRSYIASHLASTSTLSSLNQAIRIEPSNAEYQDLRGRSILYSGANLNDAIDSYQAAVTLNPYVARYWLDLAGAYQIADRATDEEQSVEQAVAADPTTPHVAWEAANFFLLQGDQPKALRNFHVVLDNDPELVESALQICWRATADTNQMINLVLPRRADLYLSFLQLLISKQETIAAEDVWNHLIALNQGFSTKLAFPYLQFLIEKQEVAPAQVAWRQLADINSSLAPYLPNRDNLIVNGGFEEKMLNGGFDWWYKWNPHAATAIDTSEFHTGTRSLSVIFDGQSSADVGIVQLVVVKPGTKYEFGSQAKTVDIDSASGPRFAIVDAYTNAPYVLTDDLLGSTPWHLQQAQFETGPNTNLVALKIVRQPAAPLIRGKLYVDDLSLIEK